MERRAVERHRTSTESDQFDRKAAGTATRIKNSISRGHVLAKEVAVNDRLQPPVGPRLQSEPLELAVGVVEPGGSRRDVLGRPIHRPHRHRFDHFTPFDNRIPRRSCRGTGRRSAEDGLLDRDHCDAACRVRWSRSGMVGADGAASA